MVFASRKGRGVRAYIIQGAFVSRRGRVQNSAAFASSKGSRVRQGRVRQGNRAPPPYIVEVVLVAVVQVAVQVSLVVEGLATQPAGPLGRHVDLGCLLLSEDVPGGMQRALQGQRDPILVQHG